MNKKLKKLTANILLMSIMLYSFPVYALTKDETVYVNLNNDGTIKKTIVNNHLINSNNLDLMEDETDLINILNINGNEPFTQEGNKLTWNSNGSDIFYQGSTEKPLPIQTSIKYYLNDEEKNLNDILGSKGKITLKLEFTNKEEHTVKINGKNETIYTPFVITTGMILKGNVNQNITVTNGKVIENGKDYLVGALSIPGMYKSLDLEELKNLDTISISFDTTKFELPNIYIVMTPKLFEKEDLKIFDKMDYLYNNVNTLKTSIDEIEKGSNDLLQGSKQIKDGNKQVFETIELISSKVNDLSQGTYELNQSIEKLVTSLGTLKLPENLNTNSITDLINANNKAIETLESLNTTNQYNQVLYALNEENKLLYSLSNQILPTMLELQKEQNNLHKLVEGSKKIYDGTASLNEGLTILTESTKQLSDGTNTFYQGLETLNSGIHSYNTDGITLINNYMNENIKTIQSKLEAIIDLSEEYKTFSSSNETMETKTKFIMKVDELNVPKEQKVKKVKTKDNKSVWQRLTNLFK